MESFKRHSIRVKKAYAISKKSWPLIIINLFFRLIEISVVLISIFKLLVEIRLTLTTYSEYFKALSSVLASPHSVFIIGNIIILTLFVKSGLFSCHDPDTRGASSDLYHEFVQKSQRKHGISQHETENRENQNIQRESRGKQSKIENRGKQSIINENREKENTRENREKQNNFESKSYHRAPSESFDNFSKSSGGKLRRWEMEKFMERFDFGEKTGTYTYPEDNMSDAEFLNKIEAFIARQRRFQKDEECCIS